MTLISDVYANRETSNDARRIDCLLIRHAQTRGNLERRYVGRRSDESLDPVGVGALSVLQRAMETRTDLELNAIRRVYVSPLKRAQESAAFLFPSAKLQTVEAFAEIDFGDFEGKRYEELASNDAYRSWLDSGGETSPPNGEGRKAFIRRTFDAFCKVVLAYAAENDLNGVSRSFPFSETPLSRSNARLSKTLAIAAHGGTAMAILSELTREDYFAFQLPPASAWRFTIQIEGDRIDIVCNSSDLPCLRLDDRIRS